MKRLGSLASALPLLALAAAGCSANNDAGGDVTFSKFAMLADFELGPGLNIDPRWNGTVATDDDRSSPHDEKGAELHPMLHELTMLDPPRTSPPSTAPSTQAYRVWDDGFHTKWGTVIYVDLKSTKEPVDLSQYTGMSIWARSAGMPGTTVKVALADWGSFDFGQAMKMPGMLCDPADTRVGGLGCFDDYSVKIYPDGAWRRYDIDFSSMATGGWGLPHPFDTAKIYRLKIAMLPGTAYDLYFDDIAFYTK